MNSVTRRMRRKAAAGYSIATSSAAPCNALFQGHNTGSRNTALSFSLQVILLVSEGRALRRKGRRQKAKAEPRLHAGCEPCQPAPTSAHLFSYRGRILRVHEGLERGMRKGLSIFICLNLFIFCLVLFPLCLTWKERRRQ